MIGNSKILIPLSVIIAGLIVAGVFVYVSKGEVLPAQEAAEIAINYINENFPAANNSASLIEVTDEGNVYRVHLKITLESGDYEYDFYITKDGKYLFPDGYKIKEETAAEVPTQDRPDVKLFVMSYCPYGLQAQKMFLPVYDLLKDKAEMGIFFVDYAMHEKQEIDENLNQYCIQKEEKEKYSGYLSCFVEDGDSEGCLSQAGIDQGKLAVCLSATDEQFNVTALYNDQSTWLGGAYPRFDVHSDLNEQYGVSGSPTVVINDTVIVTNKDYCPGGDIKCAVISDFGRTPEKFKEIICQAFNSAPEECSQVLSEEVPSYDFGGGTGSSSSGSCE
jgi:hypothetical protein